MSPCDKSIGATAESDVRFSSSRVVFFGFRSVRITADLLYHSLSLSISLCGLVCIRTTITHTRGRFSE